MRTLPHFQIVIVFVGLLAGPVAWATAPTEEPAPRPNRVVGSDTSDGYERDYTTGFMPGARFSAYLPRNDEIMGRLYGVAVELVISTWARQNDSRGPSHGRVYLSLDLLDSSKEAQASMFLYALGTTLSFERNPRRDFLVPTFTFELGGLSQRDLGQKFIITPSLGLLVWARRNLQATIDGGYLLTTSSLLDELRGLRVRAGLALTFW